MESHLLRAEVIEQIKQNEAIPLPLGDSTYQSLQLGNESELAVGDVLASESGGITIILECLQDETIGYELTGERYTVLYPELIFEDIKNGDFVVHKNLIGADWSYQRSGETLQ